MIEGTLNSQLTKMTRVEGTTMYFSRNKVLCLRLYFLKTSRFSLIKNMSMSSIRPTEMTNTVQNSLIKVNVLNPDWKHIGSPSRNEMKQTQNLI
jgi:hypothetical protein